MLEQRTLHRRTFMVRRFLIMLPVISALVACVAGSSGHAPRCTLEHLALRLSSPSTKRQCLDPHPYDRSAVFWSWLSRLWSGWQSTLAFVQPRTVIAWQRSAS